MTVSKEQRRAFRIIERVHVKHEALTEQQFENGLEELRMGQGVAEGARSRLMDLENRLAEKLYVLKSQSSQVTECLSLINQKVNMVIEQLPALRESMTSLVRQEAQTCEVSAVGMTFACSEALPPGTKLALRLLFVADNQYIETLCKVVRTLDASRATTPDKPFAIAVEFQGMKPAQKDALIQHLLGRESETLRVRRLQQTQQLETE